MIEEQEMSKIQLLKMALLFFRVQMHNKLLEVIVDIMLGIDEHGENFSLMHLCEIESKHGLRTDNTAKDILPKPALRNYFVYKRGYK